MLSIYDYKTNKNERFNLFGKVKIHLLVASGFLLTFLFFAQLVFAGSLATDGQKLSQIEAQIQKLEEENTSLKVEIARHSSLHELSQKAKDMGFEKPEKIITP